MLLSDEQKNHHKTNNIKVYHYDPHYYYHIISTSGAPKEGEGNLGLSSPQIVLLYYIVGKLFTITGICVQEREVKLVSPPHQKKRPKCAPDIN